MTNTSVGPLQVYHSVEQNSWSYGIIVPYPSNSTVELRGEAFLEDKV